MTATQTADIDQQLTLGIPGFSYADLYQPEKLAELLAVFEASLKKSDPELYNEYQAYHTCKGNGMTPQVISDILVRAAPHVGEFIARLFRIEDARTRQQNTIRQEVETIFVFRNEIVGKLASRFKDVDISGWDIRKLDEQLELLIRTAFPDVPKDPTRNAAFVTQAHNLRSYLAIFMPGEKQNPIKQRMLMTKLPVCVNACRQTNKPDIFSAISLRNRIRRNLSMACWKLFTAGHTQHSIMQKLAKTLPVG